MRKLRYSKDRLAEAKEIRLAWRNGKAAPRIPFVFTLTYSYTKAKYPFSQILRKPEYFVEVALDEIDHQLTHFPDSDSLPMVNLGILGQQVLGSMLGLREVLSDTAKPFADGVVIRSLSDDLAKFPSHPDYSIGYGPIVKEIIERTVDAADGEIPIRVYDYQSPLGTAAKLMGFENLVYAMYDEPELVHRLMRLCTDAISDGIETMERWAGDPGLIIKNYVDPFEGGGLVLWDDYVSVLSPSLFIAFCAPYNRELYDRFGAGHLHTCGPYFPGYMDAVLACAPRSIDLNRFTGHTRTCEDLCKIKQLSVNLGIRLNGRGGCDGHPADLDRIRLLAENGGFQWNEAGDAERGERLRAIAKQVPAHNAPR